MGNDKYHVGQAVLIRSVNDGTRAPHATTVTKVGRKLVYVDQYGRERAFRIEDGRANDQYGHEWLQTPEEYVEAKHRASIRETLLALGVRLEGNLWNTLSPAAMTSIIVIIEEDQK